MADQMIGEKEDWHEKKVSFNLDLIRMDVPIQPERSKREDLVHLKLQCPECKFEWEQYIDMIDHTDGLSPCLECGYN